LVGQDFEKLEAMRSSSGKNHFLLYISPAIIKNLGSFIVLVLSLSRQIIFIWFLGKKNEKGKQFHIDPFTIKARKIEERVEEKRSRKGEEKRSRTLI
jgi:hypothetical protein